MAQNVIREDVIRVTYDVDKFPNSDVEKRISSVTSLTDKAVQSVAKTTGRVFGQVSKAMAASLFPVGKAIANTAGKIPVIGAAMDEIQSVNMFSDKITELKQLNAAIPEAQKHLEDLQADTTLVSRNMETLVQESTELRNALKTVGGIEGMEATQEKVNSMNHSLQTQNQKLERLRARYNSVSQTYGETSEKALKLRESMNKVEVRIANTDAKAGKLAIALSVVEDAMDTANKPLKDAEKNLKELTEKSQKLEKELDDLGKEHKVFSRLASATNKAKDAGGKVAEGFGKAKDKAVELGVKGASGILKLANPLNTVKALAGKVGGGLVKAVKSVGTLAVKGVAAAGTAIAAGTGAAAAGIYKTTDMASDLSETINKTGVVFGKSASSIKKWANTSVEKMGLAKQTALDMASGYGDMGTSMGISQSDSAKMAQDLVQRAADLASFKNMDIDKVNTALNGVFTGETESLKSLGVVMTQANLDSYAMAHGFGKVTKDMTEAEKVSLRYQYVLDKTSNAASDFTNTSGGFANQKRIFSETLKNIGTNIGNNFIKPMEHGMGIVNKFAGEINKVFKGKWNNKKLSRLTDIFNDAVTEVGNIIRTGLPKVLNFITPIISTVLPEIIQAVYTLLPTLMDAGIQVVNTLISSVQSMIPQISNVAITVGMSLVQFLLTAVPDILNVGIQLVLTLADGIAAQLPALVPTAVNAILTFANGLISALPNIVQAGINLIGGLVDGLINSLPSLIPMGVQVLSTFMSGLSQSFGMIVQAGSQLIPKLLLGIISNLPALLQGAISLMIEFAGCLIKNAFILVKAIPRIVKGFINGLSKIDWIELGKGIIKGIGKGIVSGIKGIFGKGENSAAELTNGLTDGINTGAVQVTASATNLATSASGAFSAMNTGNAGLQLTTNMANDIKNGTDGVVNQSQMMMAQVKQTTSEADTTVKIKCAVSKASAKSVKKSVGNLVASIKPVVNKVPGIYRSAFGKAGKSAMNQTVTMQKGIKTKLDSILKHASGFGTDLKSTFNAVNLYSTGVHIMTGLSNGMESMRSTLVTKAAGMAKEVVGAVNDASGVESPSRYTIETGKYLDEGMILGMDKLKKRTVAEARSIADDVVGVMSLDDSYNLVGGDYTPENTVTNNSSRSSITNSAKFTINLYGASANDSNRRKMKSMIKETWNEMMADYSDTNPVIMEV